MNNKRQTIWLVSMLSLMVILSAYYLFTEDVPQNNNASGTQQTELISDAGKVSATNPDGVSISEVDQVTGEQTSSATEGVSNEAAPNSSVDPGSTDKNANSDIPPADEAVLNGMNNLTGTQQLDQTQLLQNEKVSKTAEELRAVISNTKVSQEEATKAWEELSRLEDIDSRITSLQEKLLQDFDNAVVSEEDENNFKVIVLSDKLEKKQAVGIVDLATKELDVTPDRVTVQYVQ
jgi:stage III sporulation protein AH